MYKAHLLLAHNKILNITSLILLQFTMAQIRKKKLLVVCWEGDQLDPVVIPQCNAPPPPFLSLTFNSFSLVHPLFSS